MDTTRTQSLRVCPDCWSTVHRDELGQHEGWHEAVRREAVAEARRLPGYQLIG